MGITEHQLDSLTHSVIETLASYGIALDSDLMSDLNDTLSDFLTDNCDIEFVESVPGEQDTLAIEHRAPTADGWIASHAESAVTRKLVMDAAEAEGYRSMGYEIQPFLFMGGSTPIERSEGAIFDVVQQALIADRRTLGFNIDGTCYIKDYLENRQIFNSKESFIAWAKQTVGVDHE